MKEENLKSIDQKLCAFWIGSTVLTRLLLAFCRKLPFFRGKGRLFQTICSTFFHGALRVHNRMGVRLKLDPTDYIGRTIAFDGSFESGSLALAVEIMSGGGAFVDVGCNFGLFTLVIGALAGVQCFAIDGSFIALKKFYEHLRMNPRDNTTIINCALAPESGLQRFEMPFNGNLGSTRIAREDGGVAQFHFWTAGTPLESALHQIAAPAVKLLKIDVEGFELSVFKGLDFDGPCRPDNIIMECDLANFPASMTAVDFLISKGYVARTIDNKPIHDFNQLPENNIWFRSERKAA